MNILKNIKIHTHTQTHIGVIFVNIYERFILDNIRSRCAPIFYIIIK